MTIPQQVLDFETSCQNLVMDIVHQQINYLRTHRKYEQKVFIVPGGFIRVDEYLGPLGAGYIINLQFGDWHKSTDFGPEGRSMDWFLEDNL